MTDYIFGAGQIYRTVIINDSGAAVPALIVNAASSPIPVDLVDPDTGEALDIDALSGALIAIDIGHHKVHDGLMFAAAYKSPHGADVANNGELQILFRVGARACHLDWLVVGGGSLEIFAYEAATYTNVGTAVGAGNMNRTSANVPTLAITHTPTMTANGNQLINAYIPGGIGNRAVGGLLRGDDEWILAPNTVYYMRNINRSGSACPIGVIFEWYEVSG